MIIIDFIKRQKYKKLLKEKILQHKKNMLKVFFDFLQTPESDSLAEDSNKLNTLWYRMLDFADELYEKENFEMFRLYYFPINKKEERKAFQLLSPNHWEIIYAHNWENQQTYIDYLNNEIKHL